VSVDDGKVTVVEPLAGAPAAAAGILPGDVVVSVDDMPVEQGNVAETVNRMRGAAGTPVTVGVMRGGAASRCASPSRVPPVQVRTVSSEYLGQGLAYFPPVHDSPRARLATYATAAHAVIEKANGKLHGVVLDLRNNPGGVLDAAVQVADEFLADGVIVSGTGRVKQARFEQYASAGDELENVSVVLL
jgi:carboxyl-terminal processing protease